MSANVQQKTIQPLTAKTVLPGTLIFTYEYAIYDRVENGGMRIRVCTMAAANLQEMIMEMDSMKFM